MTTNVQAEGLTGYLATAAELRRIAAALADLPSPTEAPPYVSLTFIPNKGDTTEETVAIIDALARAVTGKEATTERSGGSWYHLARSSNAKMYLTVQGEVPGPPDERDAELVRLRAENERLRAAGLAAPNYGCGDEARRPAHGTSYGPQGPIEEVATEERCEHCGEPMALIRSGAVGHVPGEACDPAPESHVFGCDGDHEDRSDCPDA